MMATNPSELTKREVLAILFKEKWKLILTFFALSIIVFSISYIVTPEYEASTRILVKSGQEFQVRSDPGQPIAAVPYATKQEIVNSELQILTSRDLIEAVINGVGLKKLYPAIASNPPSNERPIDAAVGRFLKDFKPLAVEQSDVINITYLNSHRDLAIQALALVVDLYQKKHSVAFSTTRYAFLEEQTKQYETNLAKITQTVTSLKKTKSLFDVDAQRAKLLDDRVSLQSILEQLQSQSVEAHRRIEFLTNQLQERPPLVVAGEATADAVEQAKTRLVDLLVKAQELREHYAVEGKPIQDTQEEMAALRRFIASKDAANRKQWLQRNPAYDELVVALDRASADLAPLKDQIALRTQQLTDIDAKLRNLEDGAQQLQELEREQRLLDELVHTYRTRYEEARINEDYAAHRAVSVSVIEPADASAKPVKPNHLIFALTGLLIGALGSLAILVYYLVFRQTLITVESVERILGIPVLTSIRAR